MFKLSNVLSCSETNIWHSISGFVGEVKGKVNSNNESRQELKEALFVSLTCFVIRSLVSVNNWVVMTWEIARCLWDAEWHRNCQNSFHLSWIPERELLTRSITFLFFFFLKLKHYSFFREYSIPTLLKIANGIILHDCNHTHTKMCK